MTRLNADGSERYVQQIDRLPIVSATKDEFSFWTPYPAGPVEHRTAVATWSNGKSDITIVDPEDGSRVFSPDLSPVADADRQELTRLAIDSRRTRPWWTAPIADALPPYW